MKGRVVHMNISRESSELSQLDTVWENIYKEYKCSGKTYATLKEELHPSFIALINKNNLKMKNALDIGCGNGKYLKYLESIHFKVTGIDSSKTAIEMARNILKPDATLLIEDMYNFIPKVEAYDFIISHATLHHGKKTHVFDLLGRLYSALTLEGIFFISLPSNNSKKNWIMMAEHDELEDGTCIPLIGPEKGLPHSFFTEDEINNCFKDYSKFYKIMDDKDGRWIITGVK